MPFSVIPANPGPDPGRNPVLSSSSKFSGLRFSPE
jgi:hypothetical protein